MILVYRQGDGIATVTPVPDFDREQIAEFAIVESLPKFNPKTQKLGLKKKGKFYDVAIKKLSEEEKEDIKKLDREREFERIDLKTRQKIEEGFEFDGHRFSLSTRAQLNWQGLLLLHQAGLFEEQHISTQDGGEYFLTENKILDFIKVGKNVLSESLEKGRMEKKQFTNHHL